MAAGVDVAVADAAPEVAGDDAVVALAPLELAAAFASGGGCCTVEAAVATAVAAGVEAAGSDADVELVAAAALRRPLLRGRHLLKSGTGAQVELT